MFFKKTSESAWFLFTTLFLSCILDKISGCVLVWGDAKIVLDLHKYMENIVKTSERDKNVKNPENDWSFLSLTEAILATEAERTREIMRKRFGLAQKDPQTLEKIGRDYDITRERVRQIIADALKKIAAKNNDIDFRKAEDKIVFTIDENDGIMEEQKLIAKLSAGSAIEANGIVFFGMASGNIKITDEAGMLKKSWIVSGDIIEKVKETAQAAGQIFAKNKDLLTDSELCEKIFSARPDLKSKYSKKELLNFIGVIARVEKNAFGKWGLKSWEEVTPKGTRERIHLILKEKKRPLHFSEIAKLIDEYKLGKRQAHPQTVHNELIKDERFVLVGRGIYALSEWGYERGTIKDVLENILKDSRKPLGREEILAKVLRKRKVKKATVMINLNNPKFFIKERNAYALKK